MLGMEPSLCTLENVLPSELSKHLPCLWEALGFFSVPQTVLLRPDSHLVQFMHSKRWSGSAGYSLVRQLLQLSGSRTVHHPREQSFVPAHESILSVSELSVLTSPFVELHTVTLSCAYVVLACSV